MCVSFGGLRTLLLLLLNSGSLATGSGSTASSGGGSAASGADVYEDVLEVLAFQSLCGK